MSMCISIAEARAKVCFPVLGSVFLVNIILLNIMIFLLLSIIINMCLIVNTTIYSPFTPPPCLGSLAGIILREISKDGIVSGCPSVGNPDVPSNKIVSVGSLVCVFTTTGYVGNVSFEILFFNPEFASHWPLTCPFCANTWWWFNYTYIHLSNHTHRENHHFG